MAEKNEIVIYTTPEGKETFEVNLKKDTVWLSQKQMAELFEKNTDTIGLHIKNIFSTEELDNKSTTEEYSVVQMEGDREVKRKIKFYNLDLIISVGYRVNSKEQKKDRLRKITFSLACPFYFEISLYSIFPSFTFIPESSF